MDNIVKRIYGEQIKCAGPNITTGSVLPEMFFCVCVYDFLVISIHNSKITIKLSQSWCNFPVMM